MAISDTNLPEVEKSSLKDIHKTKDKREKPLTKVVIRRLPPSIEQESFLSQISPVPDYDYIYTVRGDMGLGENSFARVYLNFTDPSDVYLFKEKFDNYVFLDQKGHEYPAVVEFASFQKIPKKRRSRPDPKCGTIESDPFYLEFLESLNQQPIQDEKPEYSYQFSAENKEEVITTPLLEYVKQRRIDKQRIREERREDRRKRELERKRIKDEERKKHFEDKASSKSYSKPYAASRSPKKLDIVKEEFLEKKENEEKTNDNLENTTERAKPLSVYSGKERKYDDNKSSSKIKPRFPREKFEPVDRKPDYKSKREDFKERDYKSKRYDEYKKEPEVKQYTKKVKKYSERREERKNEAKKIEQQKPESKSDKNVELEVTSDKNESTKSQTEDLYAENANIDVDDGKTSNLVDETKLSLENKSEYHKAAKEDSKESYKYCREFESRGKSKEGDPRTQRRIKNKDRPTMAIYQPGMLSKRRQPDSPEVENLKSYSNDEKE